MLELCDKKESDVIQVQELDYNISWQIIESKEQIAITKLLVKELKQEINLVKKTVDKLKLTLN